VQLLDVIRASNAPVIWALSLPSLDQEDALSLESLLLSLSMQTLALNSEALTTGINPVASCHFEDISNEDQGFQLLGRCLSGVKRLYIVLDLNLVHSAVQHNRGRASTFIEKFTNLLLAGPEKGIKLVVIAEKSDGFPSVTKHDQLEGSEIFVSGQRPGPRSRGFRRGMTGYSSHVVSASSNSRGVENWLSAADGAIRHV